MLELDEVVGHGVDSLMGRHQPTRSVAHHVSLAEDSF
jgi:hypothetical protein